MPEPADDHQIRAEVRAWARATRGRSHVLCQEAQHQRLVAARRRLRRAVARAAAPHNTRRSTMHPTDDETLNLGPCCACGGEGPTVRNIVMLDKRVPGGMEGKGWGCGVCGLPADGASVVVCDACLEAQRPYTAYIYDWAGTKQRRPIAELTEPFTHDDRRHAAERPADAAALCPRCGGAGEVWSALVQQDVYCAACSGLGLDLAAFLDDPWEDDC